ncbi:substrate-binding domain-containing protein [Streptomyces sp. H34-S4]|uniref:substrate-binding domain-containing protein n=1 Tax=Streptomyces sp. H34-S4 TaxID=2996463 RepID=UPI00226FDF7B|nr:substrate-binding domain-containing protein [Streptomyces sp. H34-S4]MCY0934008.1 substrate-binding domain-containing protein [Streptomyces sp. H34-S4]
MRVRPGRPAGAGRCRAPRHIRPRRRTGEEGLLLVCASEDPAYAENEPSVTTVTFDPERIAEMAVSSLVKLIESGHAQSPGRLTVPAGLRVRASSRDPRMY